MSPIFRAVVGSLIRHLLTSLSALLVAKGIWTTAEAEDIVAAGVLFLGAIGWAVFQKYATHLIILDALDAPAGTHLEDL